jgi:hypothetical protein
VARLWRRRGGAGALVVHSVDPRVALLLLLFHTHGRRCRGAVERQDGRRPRARPGVHAARRITAFPEQRRRRVKAQRRAVAVAVAERVEGHRLDAVEASVVPTVPMLPHQRHGRSRSMTSAGYLVVDEGSGCSALGAVYSPTRQQTSGVCSFWRSVCFVGATMVCGFIYATGDAVHMGGPRRICTAALNARGS